MRFLRNAWTWARLKFATPVSITMNISVSGEHKGLSEEKRRELFEDLAQRMAANFQEIRARQAAMETRASLEAARIHSLAQDTARQASLLPPEMRAQAQT